MGARWPAGLEQRVRALDAFLADLYGARRIVAEGVMPARVLAGAEYFEPDLAALAASRAVRVALAGLDVVRTPDGRVPGARGQPAHAVRPRLRVRRAPRGRRAARGAADPLPVEEPALALLEHALRGAAPDGVGTRASRC